MAEMLIQSENLVALADQIRVLSGTEDSMSLEAMENHVDEANEDVATEAGLIAQIASALEGKAAGGEDTSLEDAFVTRGVSGSYTNSRVTTIGNMAFGNCSSLETINFPAVTTIGGSAFVYCNNLISVSFPAAITIGSYAFASCSNLTTVNFPTVTSIDRSAFNRCASLTTASFPNVTNIESNTFANCFKLSMISFSDVTNIGSSAFYMCSNLTEASFPYVTSIGSNAFFGCIRLVTISFPACTTINNSAFYNNALTTANLPMLKSTSGTFCNCNNLTTVSLAAVTTIGANTFADCYKLKSLYLTGSSVCTLNISNAFSSTPIGGYSTSVGTYGSIYVPTSLLTSYKTATNWTYFSSRFVGI